MNRFNVAVLLLFFMLLPAFSQESDTVHVNMQSDTVFNTQTLDSIYRIVEGDLPVLDTQQPEVREPKLPIRALMYALVLPGLGQAYNGKYWKMPIVWASLGGVGYTIVYNTKKYEEATINFILDESSDNKRILDGWKRNMELSYIVAFLVYGLQVLDAYVDANLYNWDVNENLSLGISPSLQPMMTHTSLTGYSGGLTCSFKIRGR
jgi:hypothetical protein